MALPTIVTRTAKGSALSFAEADANFTNLQAAVITVSDGSNTSPIALNGTLQFTAGTGITVAESAGVVTITNTVTDTDTGILNVVEDTTPQLGGDLDLNSNDITGTGDVNITGTVVAQSTLNAQTGTTYTTVLTDASKLVTLSNGSGITLTIPANSSVAYPVGTKLDLAQLGAGQVTVVGAAGVTVNATPTLKFRAQYSGATCIKTATDTWLLVGDLATS
jgi:hypothetical protein